ncbi:MAG TPA: hypothetical protein VKA48_09805 [Gammaproteobacteria bacterium]|nr:hypothetical protein [Gammaproteobacteria bacterium]
MFYITLKFNRANENPTLRASDLGAPDLPKGIVFLVLGHPNLDTARFGVAGRCYDDHRIYLSAWPSRLPMPTQKDPNSVAGVSLDYPVYHVSFYPCGY